MATKAGLLGSTDLNAAANGTVYTAPNGQKAVGTLTFANRNATAPARIRVAVTAGANPANGEWMLYGTPLPAGASQQITMAVGPGQKVVAWSDVASVSASLNGLEEAL